MQKRSLLVQVLLDMATGGGAKLEPLIVDRAGTFDAGLNKGYNPVTVPSGNVNVYGEKSSVENHSVVVTPKVQLTRGWLNDGSVDGSGVGVTAGELVDGTYNVLGAGTTDVTNYKNISVNEGGTTSYLERNTIGEHSVRLTPKADVSAGWQDGGTVTGDSVDVDASGLVSGTYPVTASGEFDVTTYEKISVPSGVVNATAVKGVVANHSVLITPSANRTAGFINSGTTTGQDVRVDASELVSGTLNVSSAGETDVTNYEKVSVNSGSAIPSANKGAVNNHIIQVTPIVTKTAGLITSGSQSGTPVSVAASELVSGTLNVTDDGVQDVTNYQNISVPSAGHSASAHKGVVTNHSIIVTPRSTATQGFVQAGTVDGVGVTVSASELVSGKLTVTQNGIIDVTNYKEIEVSGVLEKVLLNHYESIVTVTNSWAVIASGAMDFDDYIGHTEPLLIKYTVSNISGTAPLRVGMFYQEVKMLNCGYAAVENLGTDPVELYCLITPTTFTRSGFEVLASAYGGTAIRAIQFSYGAEHLYGTTTGSHQVNVAVDIYLLKL